LEFAHIVLTAWLPPTETACGAEQVSLGGAETALCPHVPGAPGPPEHVSFVQELPSSHCAALVQQSAQRGV
jgi:hypothetical protein